MRDQVRAVICDVFQMDADTPAEKLDSDQIAEWDSVTHLTLILSLEAQFSVQFDPEVAGTLNSCDKLAEAVEGLQSA